MICSAGNITRRALWSTEQWGGKKCAVSECCGVSFGLVKNISSLSFCNTCPDWEELLEALRNTGDSNQLRLFSLPLRARSEAAKLILSCCMSHDAIHVVEIKDGCFISTWNELCQRPFEVGPHFFQRKSILEVCFFSCWIPRLLEMIMILPKE